MRPEAAFDAFPIDDLGTRPSLRRNQHNHRPTWPLHIFRGFPCICLNLADHFDDRVQCSGHGFVHGHRLIALDEERRPAAALQQLHQFLSRNACQQRGVGDLVAVKMQNRQNRTVARRIQKFVGMPRSCQRPGFCLAVADHAPDNQRGIIKNGAEGMAERISEFAALMNRSRTLCRGMARNSPRKGELRE